MAFSILTLDDGRTRVANSAGASGTSAELTRAQYAVQDALKRWNNANNWWCMFTSATASVTAASVRLPADFKYVYDVRLASTPMTLSHLPLRTFDRVLFNQTALGGPTTHYHLSYAQASATANSVITLLPNFANGDTMTLRYYRRITIASATANTLDIPEDHELGVLSLAKYFYLLDKGGPTERLQGWGGIAEDELKKAIAADKRIPDAEIYLTPGAAIDSYAGIVNPNTTIPFLVEP